MNSFTFKRCDELHIAIGNTLYGFEDFLFVLDTFLKKKVSV